MNNTITVFVDDKPKQLYGGLHVKNAIGPRKARLVREHQLVVRDQDGNVVDIDGALYQGERLYLSLPSPSAFGERRSGRPR